MGIPIPKVFITPSQNRPKFDFLVGVINPEGIPIPKGIKVKIGFLTPSQNRPKFKFSVGLINPNGFVTPNYNSSHGIYYTQSKPAKIRFFD